MLVGRRRRGMLLRHARRRRGGSIGLGILRRLRIGVSGLAVGHLEHYLRVVAEIDRGQMRILLPPLGKMRLIRPVAGEELLVAEVEQHVTGAGGQGCADILRIGEVDLAEVGGDLLAARVKVGDELLVDTHSGATHGEGIVGVDSGDDGKGEVPGGHHGGRHIEDDSCGVNQLDLIADTDEGDGSALAHGDAQLVRKETHDGGVFDPGNVLQLGAAHGERDKEDVAADVRSEDGEQVFAGELAIADGLDGGSGVDAEARVVIEKIAHFDREPSGPRQEDQGGCQEDDAAPPGFGPIGQDAFADGYPAAGAQESVVLAYAAGNPSGKPVSRHFAIGARAGCGGGAEKCFVALVVYERSSTACWCISFRHGRAGRESRRLDYSVLHPVDRQGKSGGNQERQGLGIRGLGD